MNTEKLSARLQLVADFIPNGYRLADIGSDHAYLPCYVVKRGIVPTAIAGEVVEGPFQSALRQVREEGLADKISVRKGNGLEVIESGEVDCITIAGMGGTLISTILDAGKERLSDVKRLILQPNISAISIRQWLLHNDWELINEEILEEDGKIYEVLVAERGAPLRPYEKHVNKSLLMGPYLVERKNDVFKKKWLEEIRNWEKILSQLTEANESEEVISKMNELTEKIKMAEEVLGLEKKVNGYEIIQLFESYSPKNLAMEGDKIGLQIGNLNRKVQNVMITLDVLDEVVDEAIAKNVQLIIAHHPPIFRPLQKITSDDPSGRLIEKLIKNDIAIYAAHTNLDVAKGGVNDLLADALGLQDTEVLVPTYETILKKLVVFVPPSHEEVVREAVGKAGAGSIGDYEYCSFSSSGTGRFLPGDQANPFIGSKGEIEVVEEIKIETIYPEYLEKKILSAMLKAHPYEEVAYDLFKLDNKGETLGLGRIGYVAETTLQDFIKVVKESLEVKMVRVVGDLDAKVRKVAVLGGDGNKYFPKAVFKGADVYVTGDFYYHTAHDAIAQGLNVIDPGHYVEKIMKKGVTQKLTQLFTEKGYDVNVFPSEINTDPFQFV